MTERRRLRLAVQQDAETVSEIAQRAFEGYIARIGRRPAPMDADYARHIAVDDTWVGDVDGQVVGFVVLVLEPDSLEVESIAVDPKWQGRGIGGRFLDLADERARAAGRNRVTLYTNQAMTENVDLYLSRGFVEVRRGEQDGYQRVWFVKEL
jgi:ribosomal protein S18 acetylase RimI-like enzyme